MSYTSHHISYIFTDRSWLKSYHGLPVWHFKIKWNICTKLCVAAYGHEVIKHAWNLCSYQYDSCD